MAPAHSTLNAEVLFNFPDLSNKDDKSDLSDLGSCFGEGREEDDAIREEEDDEWYELSDSEAEEDYPPILPPAPVPKAAPAPILPGAKPPPPPPLPHKEHTTGARIRAITMMDDGVPMTRVIKVTGISRSRCFELHARARERGWIEKTEMVLEVPHVANAPRSGRPVIPDEAIACILKVVTKNSTTRGFSCKQISLEVKKRGYHVAARTVWKILKAEGYNQCKLTVKPGLQDLNKKERLAWCLERKDWTLEQWKDIIFTDETSVQLGAVRGARRVWRKPEEAYDLHVIRRRWKGFSEFMFWGSFSYDKKGPCHVWEKETAEERKERKEDLDARNALIEAANKRKWQATQRAWLKDWIDKHDRRRPGGVRKTWKHTEENGAFVVKPRRNGINWYRYQKHILIAKLLPFARECQKDRPNT